MSNVIPFQTTDPALIQARITGTAVIRMLERVCSKSKIETVSPAKIIAFKVGSRYNALHTVKLR